jgi:GDP-L-fucose synthase
VETLQRITPFEAFFDKSKPSGFPRRIMDMTLAKSKIGFAPQVNLEMGLGQVWQWFQLNKNEHLSKQNYFK